MEFALHELPPGIPIVSKRASMIAAPRKRKGIKARTAATVNQTGFLARESLTIDVRER